MLIHNSLLVDSEILHFPRLLKILPCGRHLLQTCSQSNTLEAGRMMSKPSLKLSGWEHPPEQHLKEIFIGQKIEICNHSGFKPSKC